MKGAASNARTARAFTIIELLVVMAILLILAGLILATSGYVQTKGKRAGAETEIAAFSAALENYKADNGAYPTDTANGTTSTLDARTMFNPTAPQYAAASLFLYRELSGDSVGNRVPTGKAYLVEALGINSAQITARGYGASKFLVAPRPGPIAFNSPEEQVEIERQRPNRRVVIVVHTDSR